MNSLKYITLAVLFITISSCQKDEIAQIDPCDGMVCTNGSCIDGECDCEVGYTGSNCSSEKIPSKIILTDIVHLLSQEFDSNSNFWDLTGGNKADIFVKIYPELNPNDAGVSGVLNDQTHNEKASFQINYTVNKPTEVYVIELWDDDEIDELMSWGSFIPYKANSDFPQIRSFGQATGAQQIELNLSYEFQ